MHDCQGKTVLVETKDGKTQVTWEGGESVPDNFARQMELVLKGSKENFAAMSKIDPLPSLPVQVGESWTVSISNLISECEAKHGCEVKGASGSATLPSDGRERAAAVCLPCWCSRFRDAAHFDRAR